MPRYGVRTGVEKPGRAYCAPRSRYKVAPLESTHRLVLDSSCTGSPFSRTMLASEEGSVKPMHATVELMIQR